MVISISTFFGRLMFLDFDYSNKYLKIRHKLIDSTRIILGELYTQ